MHSGGSGRVEGRKQMRLREGEGGKGKKPADLGGGAILVLAQVLVTHATQLILELIFIVYWAQTKQFVVIFCLTTSVVSSSMSQLKSAVRPMHLEEVIPNVATLVALA